MLEGAHILVTGGGGFVGGYLLQGLGKAAAGARITVLKRDPDDGSASESVVADITDAAAMDGLIARLRPDIVVHLAAQASVGGSAAAAEATWKVNFQGSYNLALAVGRHVPRATLLNVSTGEVYGRSFLLGTAGENTPLQPNSPYARSKAAVEMMLQDVLPASAQLITVRPFNHTGPGQDERFVVPSFAAQIARLERQGSGASIRVGNLDACRDFLDVRDVVDAYLRILERAADLPRRSCFNVASGTARPIRQILDLLLAQASHKINVEHDPARMRPSEIEVAAGSADFLAKATGWMPQIPLEETVTAVLAHERARAAGQA